MRRAPHGGAMGRHDIAGNALTPVVDGPDRLAALLTLIEGATGRLRLLYYIFEDDATGTRVRDALLAAIARGVRVSLIVDGFGSSGAPDAFFAPLTAAGCAFCRFQPRFGRRYLLRNHQKMAVADEARAIIGGFNISDDYFREDGDAWRDFGLLIEGPATGWLARYFDALEGWITSPKPTFRALRKLQRAPAAPQGALTWLLGGPATRLSAWARAVKRDLERAKQVEMIEAYFSPGIAMLRRIRRVPRRGGRARIVTAARSDNPATVGASRFLYGRLLRRGVEVYEYLPALLHTKLIVIDDAVYIGSANFDLRSLFLNLELMLRVEDPAFAQAMRAVFEEELADCEQVTLASHRARGGLLTRIRWALSYFVVGVVDYTVSRRLNFGLD